MSQPVDKTAGGGTDAPKPLVTIPRRTARRKWAARLIIVAIVALPVYRSCVSRTDDHVAVSSGHAGTVDVTNALTHKVEPQQIAETPSQSPAVGQIAGAMRESDVAPHTVDGPSPTPEELQKPENKRIVGLQVPADEGGRLIVLIVDRNSLGPAEVNDLARIESGSLWLVCAPAQSATLVGEFASGMLSTRMEEDRLSVRLRLDGPIDANKLLLIMNARWRAGCIMEIRRAANQEVRIAFSM